MIAFNDLAIQHQLLAREIAEAVNRVCERGWYVLGPEVEAFEEMLADYIGARYAVGVANGTDAIELALRASGIGPGDEVITVSHTAVATVCAIERAGAHPVLVDIDPETCTMALDAAENAVTPRTRAIIPVHLYGHPANMGRLMQLAHRHNLLLIEDCAQALGARFEDQPVGSFGGLSCFSFYPTKTLGAFGDGGAIVTNDPGYAERLRQLRQYGQTQKYHHVIRGMNSRLDDLQAAILSVKLPHLDEHNQMRRELARVYRENLQGVRLPHEHCDCLHVYHLFVIRHCQRDALQQWLQDRGIQTMIHYPLPVHLQPAYADLGYKPGSLPLTEEVAAEVLSLPLYVGMTVEQVLEVARAVNEFTSANPDVKGWVKDAADSQPAPHASVTANDFAE